jgi:hypothetical protein
MNTSTDIAMSVNDSIEKYLIEEISLESLLDKLICTGNLLLE